TKLDNGQYGIALGPGVPGAAAQPSGGGAAAFERPRERERGEGRGRGRRGRGGAQEGREAREERVPEELSPPPGVTAPGRRSAFSLDGAFGLIKQAIGRLGGESRPVSAQELGAAIDAAGEPARRRYSLPQRAVSPRFPWATRGAPGDPEDRRRGNGPELQASDRAAAAQGCSGPAGAARQRQRFPPCADRRRRATGARCTRPRWPRWEPGDWSR